MNYLKAWFKSLSLACVQRLGKIQFISLCWYINGSSLSKWRNWRMHCNMNFNPFWPQHTMNECMYLSYTKKICENLFLCSRALFHGSFLNIYWIELIKVNIVVNIISLGEQSCYAGSAAFPQLHQPKFKSNFWWCLWGVCVFFLCSRFTLGVYSECLLWVFHFPPKYQRWTGYCGNYH